MVVFICLDWCHSLWLLLSSSSDFLSLFICLSYVYLISYVYVVGVFFYVCDDRSIVLFYLLSCRLFVHLLFISCFLLFVCVILLSLAYVLIVAFAG